MKKITIDWHQTNLTNLVCHETTVFYAFTRGGNLLYIGKAYHQTVTDEVKSSLRRLNLNSTGLSIWLGYIDMGNTDFQRITNDLVLDAECLMIYMNQPSINSHCTVNYTGRLNLRVVSRNLLSHRISSDSRGNLRYS